VKPKLASTHSKIGDIFEVQGHNAWLYPASHGTGSQVPPVEKNEKLQANNLLGRFGARLDFPRKRITGSIVLMYSSCKAKIRFELSETASKITVLNKSRNPFENNFKILQFQIRLVDSTFKVFKNP
jgi:hypothetical protein